MILIPHFHPLSIIFFFSKSSFSFLSPISSSIFLYFFVCSLRLPFNFSYFSRLLILSVLFFSSFLNSLCFCLLSVIFAIREISPFFHPYSTQFRIFPSLFISISDFSILIHLNFGFVHPYSSQFRIS